MAYFIRLSFSRRVQWSSVVFTAVRLTVIELFRSSNVITGRKSNRRRTIVRVKTIIGVCSVQREVYPKVFSSAPSFTGRSLCRIGNLGNVVIDFLFINLDHSYCK